MRAHESKNDAETGEVGGRDGGGFSDPASEMTGRGPAGLELGGEFSLWLRQELRDRGGDADVVMRRPGGGCEPAGETMSSPGSLIRHLESLARLDRARRRLPAEYAEAIRLRHEEDLSLDELGERVGCRDATSLWGRAVLRLAELMEGPGGESRDRLMLEGPLLASLIRFDETLRLGRVPLSRSDDECEGEQLPASVRRCLLTLETFFPRAATGGIESEEPHEGQVSRFVLREFIGSGGFGVVYKAHDPVLGREVAVKMPRPQYLTDPQTARRFVREARAAAKLDHPNVVPIYEAGLEGDVPFIAYAFCEGPTLSAWFRDQDGPLPNKLAAQIVEAIARAVDYSHQRGIIHRDIKPANVLLFPQEPAADAHFPFVPRLADLGLAKPLDSADGDESISFEFAGTPSYMAPEQAGGRPEGLGRASDVYSLGAVLYYLLTMRPPLAGVSWIETIKEVVEREPASPRLLNRAVEVDLATISLKCLEKLPERRYASAGELADDLNRYLRGEPIVARPAARIYRVRRWCQRRPAVAALLGGVVLLAAGLGLSLTRSSYLSALHREELREQNADLRRAVEELDAAIARSERQRRIAESNEARANRLSYVSDLQAANVAMRHGDLRMASAMLSRSRATLANREFGWFYLHNKVSPPSEQIAEAGQTIWCLKFSPDGRTLAVAGNRGRVTLYDVGDEFRRAVELETDQREVNSLAFSPDGRMLATAGDDGRIGLWDLPGGRHRRWIEALPGRLAFGVAFIDAGSKVVACGQSKDISVWHVDSGSLDRVLATPHERTIESLAVSRDGQQIVTAGAEGIVAAIDPTGRRSPRVFDDFGKTITVVGFTSDGRSIVAGNRGGKLRVFDADTTAVEFELHNPEGFSGLAIGEDGSFAVSDRGGTVQILDRLQGKAETAAQWQVLDHWAAHDRRVSGLAYSTRSGLLLTGDSAGRVRRWATDLVMDDQVFELPNKQSSPSSQGICAGPTANQVFYASPQGLSSVDIAAGKLEHSRVLDIPLIVCRYLDDRQSLLLGDHRGQVGIMPLNGVSPPQWTPLFGEGAIHCVSAAKASNLIAAVGPSEECKLYDREKGEVILRFENICRCELSSGGQFLAVARHGTDDIAIYDTGSGERIALHDAHQSTVNVLTFGAADRLLLSAANDRTAVLWDTSNWTPRVTLLGHGDAVQAGAISPDAQTVATGDRGGRIKLWLAADGAETIELPPLGSPVRALCFAADGQTLYAATEDSRLHVFPAARRPQR